MPIFLAYFMSHPGAGSAMSVALLGRFSRRLATPVQTAGVRRASTAAKGEHSGHLFGEKVCSHPEH